MSRNKKVGKYELGKTLGSGSFSKVKLGIDDHGKQFAVKMIEKEQLVKEGMEDQLKREISVMKLLNHPHIVKLYDVLQTSNHIYLVLELVTGGELFDRLLQAKFFNEDTARRFFQQLVVALHFCHRHGVAHRDLKPENLLVDDRDNIKITDFGLANIQRPGALMQTVCGTPNYVAPEVLKEQGYNGLAADVWSAGIMLFVMLSGCLPFDDPVLDKLFEKVQKGQYQMSSKFSPGARDLISQMLVVDPMKRVNIDGVIKHPWFQKNFDRAVFDSLSKASSQPVQVSSVDKHAGAAKIEEDGKETGSPTGGASSDPRVGAFELIDQLTLSTMSSLATKQPQVKISTRFIVSLSPDETMKNLIAGLEAAGASAKPKTDLDLRGFQTCPKGLLNLVITIVPTLCPDLTIIEIRRGRGDTFDFHAAYHGLVKFLGDAVVSKPANEEVSEN